MLKMRRAEEYPQEFVDRLERLTHTVLVPDLTPEAVQRRVNAVADTGLRPTKRQLEAQIRGNDFLDVNYLELGQHAARSVCLIQLTATFERSEEGTATGFLVGPSLLLTNHHVLPEPQDAERAQALFGYEYDVDGNALEPARFDFDPATGFWTDKDLDFTLVSLRPSAQDGTSLDAFGFLRLNPNRGKTDQGLNVTVIGHPGGHHKQISLRENRVLIVGKGPSGAPLPPVENADTRLWYEADTLPGSSGSPVFNDLFQVVALHHEGVPRRRVHEGGVQYLLAKQDPGQDANWVPEAIANRMRSEELEWIANEGVRVSSLVQRVEALRAAETDLAWHATLQQWLDDVMNTRNYPGTPPKAPVVYTEERTTRRRTGRNTRATGGDTRPPSYYAGARGYDPNFLGITVPLPSLGRAQERFGPAATVEEGGTELRYTHFSVVLSERRRLAFFTAVNIDGAQLEDVPRDDRWYYDPRVDARFQVGDELYSREPGAKGYFDRGHLVRRRDPVWGPVAQRANDDTFHWTNCSPQYWNFNQSDAWWQGLEDYILLNTDQDDLHATVFTGPVFAEDDEVHRGVAIPQRYWKVVVVLDDAGHLTTSAYVVSQEQYAKNIPFEERPVGQVSNFQVSVARLEQLTGLDFGDEIRRADVLDVTGSDGEGTARPLRRPADLLHSRRVRLKPTWASQERAPKSAVPTSLVRWAVPGSQRGVLVEVEPPRGGSSVLGQEFGGADNVERVGADFERALSNARPMLDAVAKFLQELNHPNEASVQLGLKLTAGADVILAKLSTEGSMAVTLKWTRGP